MAVPFVQAKWYTDTGSAGRTITCIVLHSVEVPELPDTAKRVALAFKAGQRVASAHKVFDAGVQFQCVKDKDVAYAAPGCNSDGLHYEHAGYARQSRAEWLDDYSTAMLHLSARQAAEDCIRYGIRPDRYLTAADLVAGRRQGITTHHQITLAWHKTTHTDPGPGFPMDVYLGWVTAEYAALTGADQGDISMANAQDIMNTLGSLGMRIVAIQNATAGLPDAERNVGYLQGELLSHDDDPATHGDQLDKLHAVLDNGGRIVDVEKKVDALDAKMDAILAKLNA